MLKSSLISTRERRSGSGGTWPDAEKASCSYYKKALSYRKDARAMRPMYG